MRGRCRNRIELDARFYYRKPQEDMRGTAADMLNTNRMESAQLSGRLISGSKSGWRKVKFPGLKINSNCKTVQTLVCRMRGR